MAKKTRRKLMCEIEFDPVSTRQCLLQKRKMYLAARTTIGFIFVLGVPAMIFFIGLTFTLSSPVYAGYSIAISPGVMAVISAILAISLVLIFADAGNTLLGSRMTEKDRGYIEYLRILDDLNYTVHAKTEVVREW